MLKYDLHTHTNYSKCSSLKPENLLKTAKKRGLNGIAVTDHGTIKGALEAKRLNKDKDFEVIIGEEISTVQGDVLAYYLNEQIDAVDFFDAVKKIRKQNGLVIIPHPFRTSIRRSHKFRIPLHKIKKYIDAVEAFNGRMLFSSENKKADETANKYGIAKTAGSDAHFKPEIATGYTLFDGDLRKALKEKSTRAYGKLKFGAFGGLLSFLKNRASSKKIIR